MAAITLPNNGLKVGYPDGDNTWGADMNRNLRILDALANMRVLDKDLTTPPGSPTAGATYIVATGATGAWAGQDGKLAIWEVGDDLVTPAWFFVTPKSGWRTYVVDEDERYQYGTSWTLVVDGGGGGTGIVESIVAGSGISVNNADPANPIVTATASAPTQAIPIACSDESTAITAGAGKVTFRMPFAFTLSAVRASLTTAQTGGSILTVDINEDGTSILSTKLTIDNGEKTSTSATTAAVISDANLGDDSEITIDIDQIGDGTAKGLKVYLIGVRT